jgi:hypothetical protein
MNRPKIIKSLHPNVYEIFADLLGKDFCQSFFTGREFAWIFSFLLGSFYLNNISIYSAVSNSDEFVLDTSCVCCRHGMFLNIFLTVISGGLLASSF